MTEEQKERKPGNGAQRVRRSGRQRRSHRLQDRRALLWDVQGRAGHRHPRDEEQDHRLHRAVGLRQEHGAAVHQPDERPRAGLPLQGARPLSRAGHLPFFRGPCRRAPLHRHGLPAAEPLRHERLQQRRLRPAPQPLPGVDTRQGGGGPRSAPPSGTRSRTSSTRAAFPSPAASSSASASPGHSHGAGSAPHGRALLRPRPHRHEEDRGADARAEGAATPSPS